MVSVRELVGILSSASRISLFIGENYVNLDDCNTAMMSALGDYAVHDLTADPDDPGHFDAHVITRAVKISEIKGADQ